MAIMVFKPKERIKPTYTIEFTEDYCVAYRQIMGGKREEISVNDAMKIFDRIQAKDA